MTAVLGSPPPNNGLTLLRAYSVRKIKPLDLRKVADCDQRSRRNFIVHQEKPNRRASDHSKGSMFWDMVTKGLNDPLYEPLGMKSTSHPAARAIRSSANRCQDRIAGSEQSNSGSCALRNQDRFSKHPSVEAPPQTRTRSKPCSRGWATRRSSTKWVTPPPSLRTFEASIPIRIADPCSFASHSNLDNFCSPIFPVGPASHYAADRQGGVGRIASPYT